MRSGVNSLHVVAHVVSVRATPEAVRPHTRVTHDPLTIGSAVLVLAAAGVLARAVPA